VNGASGWPISRSGSGLGDTLGAVAPLFTDEVDGPGRFVLPERRWSPGKQVAFRAAIALGCLVATTMLVYFGREGYTDNSGQPITPLSAAYYATVSLSTTGYGDIVPVTPGARLINILIITPLRVLFLIVLVGTTIEVLTQRTRELRRERSWRHKVNHHTIVIGFGVKGRSAVQTLLQSGEGRDHIAVVTNDPIAVAEASRLGVITVLGDARREDVLDQVEVRRADRVIVAVDEDDATVLITLAVKRMNPSLTIVAAARESSNSELIRASGASSVIPTAEASGQLLGLASVAPEAGEFMEDLLDPAKGLEIVQRPVTRDEIGMEPSEMRTRGMIALAVIRDGEMYRFDEPGVRVLQRGDQMILISPSKKKQREQPTDDS
jgi:voltage-gated potassium channel